MCCAIVAFDLRMGAESYFQPECSVQVLQWKCYSLGTGSDAETFQKLYKRHDGCLNIIRCCALHARRNRNFHSNSRWMRRLH